jgi:uncharacterized protein YyaL (SSP411 family)
MFCAVSVFGAAFDRAADKGGPDAFEAVKNSAEQLLAYNPRIWMTAGELDFSKRSNDRMHDLFTSLGISHEYTVAQGLDHNYGMYADRYMNEALASIGRVLGKKADPAERVYAVVKIRDFTGGEIIEVIEAPLKHNALGIRVHDRKKELEQEYRRLLDEWRERYKAFRADPAHAGKQFTQKKPVYPSLSVLKMDVKTRTGAEVLAEKFRKNTK